MRMSSKKIHSFRHQDGTIHGSPEEFANGSTNGTTSGPPASSARSGNNSANNGPQEKEEEGGGKSNTNAVTYMVEHHAWEKIVTLFIVLNTIALGITHEGQPQALTDALVYVNYVFTAVFFVEMVRGARRRGRGKTYANVL